MQVFTKKAAKSKYFLSTFNESIQENPNEKLAEHIIEEPHNPEDGQMLVYEEISDGDGEPRKFYGYRDDYKSANKQRNVPNFALMIYDKKKGGFRIVPVDTHVKFQSAVKLA